MNDAPALTRYSGWVLTVAVFLAGPVLSVAPLGMSPLLIAGAALAYILQRIQGGRWLPIPAPAILFSVSLIAWCALSLIWDLNPASGARKLIDLVVIVACLSTGLGLGRQASADQRKRLAVALVGGLAFGLVLLAIEVAFDFPLYRLVMGSSNPKLADLIEVKRSADALPLLVWPACFALARLGLPWAGAMLAAVFSLACIKLTASSATLGMFLSLVILAACFMSVAWMRRLLAVVTLLAFILIIPLAIIGYEKGGTTAPFLKHSAQHRVEIWHFAAERALERPLFGYGFNASRYVPNGDAVSDFLPPGQSLIPLHPHDGFLQIWLELGAVGAIIAAAGLLALLNALRRWPASAVRFILPGYAAGLVIAGLAFGIWQSWWMATIAFSMIAYRLTGPGPDHV